MMPLPQMGADGSLAAPKRVGYKFDGWYATSVDTETGNTVEVAYYKPTVGVENGWMTALEGNWNDLTTLTTQSVGGNNVEKLVLKAHWTVMISGTVPASITFNIDPVKMEAEGISGTIKSYTPEDIQVSKMYVKSSESGLRELFGEGGVNGIELNLGIGVDGGTVYLGIPSDESVDLTNAVMQYFKVPAAGSASAPGELPLTYTIDLSDPNLQLQQVLNATNLATLHYEFALVQQ